MSIIENLISIEPSVCEKVIEKTYFMSWLLQKIGTKKEIDSVQQYAAELLAILLQSSTPNRIKLAESSGVDTLLQTLSRYRKRDPVDEDETEFLENVFDSLCLCLSEPSGKKKFLDGEGLELMILLIK